MARHPLQSYLVRFGQDDTIFKEGDAGATMFIVQAGQVGVFRTVDDEERSLGVMEKGDFFGEMAILEGIPRTHTARALDDVELIEINSTTFDKMIQSNIEIAIRLLRKQSIRLREVERRNAELQAAGARVAKGSSSATPAASSRQPAAAVDGPRLEIEGADEVYAVQGDNCMIGRFDPVTELRPDIDLTDIDTKRSVSRRHARIQRDANGFTLVEEVGALNGTFVNGNKLVTGQPETLNDGDEIGVGTVRIFFRAG